MELQFLVRIPGGLADRLLRRGIRESSSQAERERADILDRVEWLCEIRRRRTPENARSVGTSNQYMQCSGLSHGFLHALKPFLAIAEALGLQVGNARIYEVSNFLERDEACRSRMARENLAGKLNAPKHVLCVRVTRITGDNRLCKCRAFFTSLARNDAIAASTITSGSPGANLRASSSSAPLPQSGIR